jgi:HPt (histidine-containing phosphotransfer) domain-containing protein
MAGSAERTMEPRREPVDYRTLEQLRALSAEADPELLDLLLRDFLDATPGFLAGLEEQAGKGQWREVARVAHSLAGSAGTVGAEELRRLARAVEVAVDAGREAEARAGLAALAPAFARARGLLETWRAGVSAPPPPGRPERA